MSSCQIREVPGRRLNFIDGSGVVGTGPSGGAGGWVLLDDFVTSSEVGQVRMRLQTLVMLALGFFGLVVPGGP